jgi:flotillin
MEAEAKGLNNIIGMTILGQLHILKAKADGMRMMVESCGGSKDAFQLLMLEHLDKLAETAATAISNIKFDKVQVLALNINE